jgi:hypothetical protein
MSRRAPTLLALVCALCLWAPAMAGAASDTPQAAITDCNDHGQLTAHYSPATLQAALGQMPVDVREYTDCYDVIERQLLVEQGKTASGSGSTAPASSSGSFLPTWLIIVIVLLALGAVTFGALAIRRRGETPAGPGGPGAGGAGAGGAGESQGPGGPPPPPESGPSEAPTKPGAASEAPTQPGAGGSEAPTQPGAGGSEPPTQPGAGSSEPPTQPGAGGPPAS